MTEDPRFPEHDNGTFALLDGSHAGTLWRLRCDTHNAGAELWNVSNGSVELRVWVDNHVDRSIPFSGPRAREDAELAARRRRQELEAKGWAE